MATRKDVTTIQRTNDPDAQCHWRAHIRLTDAVRWPLPVCGGTTKDGPWVEGYGHSQDAALGAAYEALGRAAASMAEEPVEAPQQASEGQEKPVRFASSWIQLPPCTPHRWG